MTPLPQIVSPTEPWEAHDALLAKEKQATRARDALAAERRRLPMVEIESDYVFAGPEGDRRLIDLFDGGRTLIVYSGPSFGLSVFVRDGGWWRRHDEYDQADRQATTTGEGNR